MPNGKRGLPRNNLRAQAHFRNRRSGPGLRRDRPRSSCPVPADGVPRASFEWKPVAVIQAKLVRFSMARTREFPASPSGFACRAICCLICSTVHMKSKASPRSPVNRPASRSTEVRFAPQRQTTLRDQSARVVGKGFAPESCRDQPDRIQSCRPETILFKISLCPQPPC